MTRFARARSTRKPGEASSWQELQKTSGNNEKQSQQQKTSNSKSSSSPSSFKHKNLKTKDASLQKTDDKSKPLKKMKMDKHDKGRKEKPKAKLNIEKIGSGRPTTTGTTGTSTSSSSSKSKQTSISCSKGFAESSKSLIEELEEMDRQQMAEIKQDIDQQKNETGADRLHEINQGDDTGHMNKQEKRSEERRLKRQRIKSNKMVCYHCREPGHGVADCPKALEDAEQGSGVCYRCGTTEHDSSKCTARIDPNQGEFPFAKCFICQEMGHLSKSCPDNPKGLYPMGGCCKHCESVEHMSWNCPQDNKVKGVTEVHVSTVSSTSYQSADAEIFEVRRKAPVLKKKHKVVKF